jgi:DNA invertase Pin-like site-specific DNA recombinase
MASGRFISYLRVSTARQGASGLGVEAQRESVARHLNGGNWKLIEEVIEVESGKRNDRPELTRALALCRIHKATLIVAKLDRLARNVFFTSSLMEAKVDFIAVDMPTANRLTIHILAAVAEHEAEAISQRTKAALAAAKARGTVLGGDRGKRFKIASVASKGNAASQQVRTAKAEKWMLDIRPVIADAKAKGAVTLREIAAVLNQRGIPTARGGRWSASQVLYVLSA